jgi:hypothetical protein
MKNELDLPALEGTNPLGYLAALGVRLERRYVPMATARIRKPCR